MLAAKELMKYRKAQGAGVLSRITNANKHIAIACNNYIDSDLEEVLVKGATIINYNEIKVVKVKNYGLMENDDQHNTNEIPVLVIETMSIKIPGYFIDAWSFLENMGNLKIALGEKFKC